MNLRHSPGKHIRLNDATGLGYNDIAQKLLIYPTESFYALGCTADSAESCRRLFSLKQRSADTPLLVLTHSTEAMQRFGACFSGTVKAMLDRIFPAALTVVLPVERPGGVAHLGSTNGRVGFRIPRVPALLPLLRSVDCPLVGTSANVSGMPPASDTAQLPASLSQAVDLIIDGGTLPGNQPSTVLELHDGSYRIIRAGAFDHTVLAAGGFRLES